MKSNGVWQKYELDIYTRDVSCNTISGLSLIWNESTQSWVNSFLYTYSYGKNGNSQVFTQSWDAVSNTWVNYANSALVYSKTKTTYTYQMWDAGSNSWINNYRLIDELDDQGRSIVNEFDLYSNSEWQKIQRGLNSFNDSNQVTANIFQVWTNNAWVNNGKTTYSYTGNGETVQYGWDIGDQKWIKFSRAFNEYLDGTTSPLESQGQILSGSIWQNSYRSESNYNDANLMLSSFQQNWDVNSDAWFNASKFSSDYYADNNQRHFSFEGWDATTNSWLYGYRATYTDVSCSSALQLVPVSETKNNTGIFVQNKNGNYLLHRMPATNANANGIIQRTFNPLASNGHQLVYDLTIKGKEFELILSPVTKPQNLASKTRDNIAANKSSFVISPNPAKSYLNINLAAYKNAGDITMKISDISGKPVLQQKINAGTQRVNISSLQKGIYIVAIISGKEVQTQKLAVE